MTKVVIQGASGLKNSGDEAILQAILQKLDNKYDITVVTFQVEYSEKMHLGVHFVKMGSRQCMRAIKECQIFILGGGGLIQDETSVYNVSRWMKYLKYCIKEGKKTCLYANSIGPIRFSVNRKLAQKWLKKVDVITVRDELSREMLKDIGICANVELTADPVFSIRTDQKTDVSRFSLAERYAVICVRHWYDTHPLIPVSICTRLHIRNKKNIKKYHDYIEKVAELSDYLKIEYGLQVILLPFLQGRDNKVAEDIARQMKSSSVVIEDEYLKPDEAIKIISESQLLVGMRLHSIIYGAVSEIPTLILSYSSKVKGMAEYLHMEDYTLAVDSMDVDKMKELVNEIMRNRTDIRMKLREAVQLLREKEARNSEVVKELEESI